MEDKLNSKKVSLALGSVSFVLSIICLLLIAAAPAIMTNVFGSIFHGIDITQIAAPISWGNAILGVIVVAVIGLIAGWLFAVIYNKFN